MLSENQESWMETVVEGPGKLSFWWKVSSAEDLDYLDFSINGDLQQRISGEPGWQLESFTLNPGANRLRWRFKKGSDASHGQNAGWVDNVVW
ncbi:hypothetical protein RZS08_34490, partial [Arthrospira platensis SPKY1]|nr:hypothetical protein [Arthrospira platensis SPKY1]